MVNLAWGCGLECSGWAQAGLLQRGVMEWDDWRQAVGRIAVTMLGIPAAMGKIAG